MPKSVSSPATATWATARSPSCGGQHEHAGARAADACADPREPALLGWPARGQADAAALRRVRKGAALSAAGLPALLLDGERVQGGTAQRPAAHLYGVPPSLQLLLQG